PGPAATLGLGGLDLGVYLLLGEARRRRDEAHRASLGGGAVQRPLRPAQDLHPLQVEQLRERSPVPGGRAGIVALLQRRVVEVDAGGRRAELRSDAADGDVGIALVVVAAKGQRDDRARQIL